MMIHRKVLFNVLLAACVLLLLCYIFFPDQLNFLMDMWVLDADYEKDSQFLTSAGGPECHASHWMERYQAYHARTVKLAGKRGSKYLVYHCKGHHAGCGGYGNRMLGIVSTFYLAVVLNRTFLLHWGGPEQLELYYQPNKIDWRYDASMFSGVKIRENRWGVQKVDGYERQVSLKEPKFNEWFLSADIVSYFDMQVETMTTMWYFTPKIWQNAYLKKLATKAGIPRPKIDYPWGMVGCAMNFLFKKSRGFVKEIRKARAALSQRQRPIIGIHIRTSDHHFGSFNEFSYRTRDFRAVFACAQRVEKAFKHKNHLLAGKTFTWFLATDNKKVKAEALRRHPDNVVTLDIIPYHIEHTKTKFGEILQDLLLDQLLLQECDYFLPTFDSTFSYMVIGTRQIQKRSFVFGEKCALDEKGVAFSPPVEPTVKSKPP